MLMAKIEGNRIVELIDTDSPEDYPGFVEIPEHVPSNADLRFFHEDYSPKTVDELIAEGLIEPEEDSEEDSEEEPPTDEELAAMARNRRDALLSSCDWVVVRSNELNEPVPEGWSEYRQALRDIPQQPGFPNDVEWPVRPNADT